MAEKLRADVYEFNVLNLDSNKRMIHRVIVPLAIFIFRFLVTNILNLKFP